MKIIKRTKVVFTIVIVTILICYGTWDFFFKEKEEESRNYIFSILMDNNTFREDSLDKPINITLRLHNNHANSIYISEMVFDHNLLILVQNSSESFYKDSFSSSSTRLRSIKLSPDEAIEMIFNIRDIIQSYWLVTGTYTISCLYRNHHSLETGLYEPWNATMYFSNPLELNII